MASFLHTAVEVKANEQDVSGASSDCPVGCHTGRGERARGYWVIETGATGAAIQERRHGRSVRGGRGSGKGQDSSKSRGSDDGALRVDPREIVTAGDMGPAGIRAVKHYRRCLCVNQKKHTLWRGDPAPCSMGLIIESQAGFQSTVAPSLQTPS